ncbi:MAG: RIP metalloprotease RseP [Fretibacterium sp.]|nr:RIP metalloprotease RseP [Fretibacterium sp.]
MLTSIIAFLIVIGICVVVHEYGHYITARVLGVQVHEFAFGMGPVLKQIEQQKESRMLWSLRLFPIGGFCRLAGMGEEADEEVVLPGMGFNEQAAWKRFLILLNGSLFNIVLALLLTAVFLWGHGVMNMDDTKIGALMEGFPGQAIGLKAGDRVLSVNGEPVGYWREMSKALREGAAKGEVALEVQRGESTLSFTVALPVNEEYGYPMLGVTPALQRYGALEAIANAAGYTWRMTRLMLKGVWDWIAQRQEVDVTGPIGIASMSGRALREGAWSFVTFLALISLNLGLLNLFPIPALDGGRIIFILFEMVFRRRMPEKWENLVHLSGFFLLIALMIFVTWQDIYNLFFTR